MPRKKHRHRADGEHFFLDIPFNRTLLHCAQKLPQDQFARDTLFQVPNIHVSSRRVARLLRTYRDSVLFQVALAVRVRQDLSRSVLRLCQEFRYRRCIEIKHLHTIASALVPQEDYNIITVSGNDLRVHFSFRSVKAARLRPSREAEAPRHEKCLHTVAIAANGFPSPLEAKRGTVWHRALQLRGRWQGSSCCFPPPC